MNFLKRIRVIFFLIGSLYALNSIAQPGKPVDPDQTVVPAGVMGAQPIELAPVTQASLIIGVDRQTPPFSMQGGQGELYGFDIDLMNSLCKLIERTCQFRVMKWIELMPAIESNQIDLAVSSITITPDRAKQLTFSIPYAVSYSRLLANRDTQEVSPFALSSLSNKRIAVQGGTIYADQASRMGVNNVVIKIYANDPLSLEALANKEVDYVLLDNPTALYWAANSDDKFKVIGEPFSYGFGIGIAISAKDLNLLPELNKALLFYQNSDEYRQNYRRYLDFF